MIVLKLLINLKQLIVESIQSSLARQKLKLKSTALVTDGRLDLQSASYRETAIVNNLLTKWRL